MANDKWQVVKGMVALGDAEPQVWTASLTLPEEVWQRWLPVISTEARQRMDRFRRPEDRRRYLAEHAILQFLLARYPQAPPPAFRFGKN